MQSLNLVPDMVSDAQLLKIIKMADYDGDGQINYAEFARLVDASDIYALKNTLTAADATSSWA
jgi:Ca2+-binding EF-hand superfamily protein